MLASASRRSKALKSSSPEMPSTMAWWAFTIMAKWSSPTDSTSQSSHSGFPRSSFWDMMRPASRFSWRRSAGGGSAANFVNLHFFSPAEHPMMQLVEIIRGADTSDDAVATAHAFVRRIGKTPLVLNDGSPGFLVNAGLAAYFQAAEELLG